jgi:putative SOS response-associated peptidase YedK
VPANELVTQIHDRMLAILPNDRFARWLSDEADPRVLLVPFPADQLAVSSQRSRRWSASSPDTAPWPGTSLPQR